MRHISGIRFIPIILIFVVLLTACGSKKKEDPKKGKDNPPTVVDIIIAEPQPISNIVEANGTVVAKEYMEIQPEVRGRLT